MSRWKKLPEPLDQRVRQLVVQMRRLKDHSGLSLEALAARTAYSSSSWERYLNGKKLPPRQAVVELAQIAETDPTRLLVLHELAEDAWGRPDALAASGAEAPDAASPAPDAVGPDGGAAGPPLGRRRRAGALIAAAVALVAVLAVVLVVTEPWSDGGSSHASSAAASTTPTATATATATAKDDAPHYDCTVQRQREDGRLYAGNSRTSVAIIQLGMVGPEVAEAQCLLKHAGYEFGAIDGRFGNMTERAVKRAQKKGGVVADGKVGPDTWPVLRR
ncbi:peptidoglycan-binding protein [Streptomyces sp. NPDC057654]|uniref:peptidoglycan-binding protein n=1 Tax=Streptomyces sp. NPDC057654 TaxID=3346196 RepID=UPI0036CAC029